MEWILMSDRKPTSDDADEYGCVMVWHLFQGVMVTGWSIAGNGIYITHWMRTPDAPIGAKDRQEEIESRIMGSRFRTENGNKK